MGDCEAIDNAYSGGYAVETFGDPSATSAAAGCTNPISTASGARPQVRLETGLPRRRLGSLR